MSQKFLSIETFVGAGGFYLGFKKCGFHSLYVNDIDENFLKTLTYNNKELRNGTIVDSTPIEKINFKKLRATLNLKKKDLDLILGGPVCKGYSLAGVRDPSDSRNTLYRHQIKLISEFLPKICIIENVPAMRTSLILKSNIDKKKVKEISYIWKQLDVLKGIKAKLTKRGNKLSFKEEKFYKKIKLKKKYYEKFVKKNSVSVIADIERMLKKAGYRVQINNLNAAWYGSHTKRTRTFVVGVRKDIRKEFEFPKISHFDFKTKLNGIKVERKPKPFKTIKEAFELIDYHGQNSQKNDSDNMPMKHAKKSINRFKLIPKGKNFVEVMHKAPKHLKISRFYSRGCTMRLDDRKPSPTLVPGHSNFPVHPHEHRSISVREAAQITGFPLNYKFFGNHTKRCEQVGNAVPIPLAHALAIQCKKIL